MGSDRRRNFATFAVAFGVLVGTIFAALVTTGVASDTPGSAPNQPSAEAGSFNLHGQTLPKNSVGSKQIKNHQVKHVDLGKNAVHGNNICPDCVTGREVKESTLGKVPSSALSDHATNADHASTADHATNADKATAADTLTSQTSFQRHLIAVTPACSGPNICLPDGGNVENLATIGPIHVDGVCRITSGNGSGEGGRYPDPSMPNPSRDAHQAEREAQILVWSETGSLSFTGRVGPRSNVPAGPIDFTQETGVGTTSTKDPGYGGTQPPNAHGTSRGDPVAGEGNHLLVAASNEVADESRPVPGSTQAITGTNTQGFIFPALSSVPAGWIALSDPPIDLTITAMAGFGILGLNPDQCVFSGLIQKI